MTPELVDDVNRQRTKQSIAYTLPRGNQLCNRLPTFYFLIHSHDTGRFVQPYGFQVPTPNIQLLADQGVLFREAFCAAPTCSGSRPAF